VAFRRGGGHIARASAKRGLSGTPPSNVRLIAFVFGIRFWTPPGFISFGNTPRFRTDAAACGVAQNRDLGNDITIRNRRVRHCGELWK